MFRGQPRNEVPIKSGKEASRDQKTIPMTPGTLFRHRRTLIGTHKSKIGGFKSVDEGRKAGSQLTFSSVA